MSIINRTYIEVVRCCNRYSPMILLEGWGRCYTLCIRYKVVNFFTDFPFIHKPSHTVYRNDDIEDDPRITRMSSKGPSYNPSDVQRKDIRVKRVDETIGNPFVCEWSKSLCTISIKQIDENMNDYG